jgi:aconitate hydratase
MAFDLDMIKGGYTRMQERVEVTRKVVGKPLTLKRFLL